MASGSRRVEERITSGENEPIKVSKAWIKALARTVYRT